MITIGYNQVQEKHVADTNSTLREDAHEAKKVYVGNKLAHVHVNDNTEFALRQTLNGYIHEGNDLYAKISKINGNTKVWNQLYDTTVPTAISGHKYYISENNSGTTVKSIATTISYTADSTDRMCIDLTLIYGAGNEPTTVAEFEADFQQWFGRPIGAEPYDAGSLIPFIGTGIKSVGFNLWDEEWEAGYYDASGNPVSSTGQIRAKNLIKVIPNIEYYFRTQLARAHRFCYYDTNGVFIGRSDLIPANNTLFTIPADCHYIKFHIDNEQATYNHDICINLSNPTLNGTYVPYKATTVPIPVTTLTGKQSGSSTSEVIFPDGMKSAGSVKDELYVEDGKTYAVKRVGSRAYTSGDESDTTVTTDGNSTTHYPLATPIVYEVDNYTLPLYYLANGTGTEELLSTATTAPADMDIEYRLLEEEWYGIRWRMTDDNWVSPVRIGNPRLHQELPIQSMMKRCALVNGVPKFISESNVDEYEDGTPVDYANTDIYVQIPEYYFEATKDDDGWCELKIHTKVKIGTKSRLYYEGAWLATLDNNVLGSKSYIDFNTIGSPTDGTYNAALFKNATNFVANTPHGGNGSTTYDDTEGCTIGRPKTSITIANFRTYANNNSNRHGIVNYDCWCSIMRLFMVEFCSFYSQAAIDDTLTVHKFRKGGLSAGVTSGLTNWSNFNGYNPLIPCGFTKSLGNRTGVVKMHYAAEGAQTRAVDISVPSYRGIEEPFGDIYNFVDGIAIYGDGADTQKASIYIATTATIDNIAYVTPSGANAAPTGYELLTDDAPYKEASDSETTGWIKVWHWDEHGMFAPLKTGGNSVTIGITDYMYMYNGTGWRLLLAGGAAGISSFAGLGCFYGYYGFGASNAAFGSRLLYTPADMDIEYRLVDMGTPGVLWADSDIDITKPDGFCDSAFTYDKSFFSWGNVVGHNPISNTAFDYDWGSINQPAPSAPWYDGQPYGSTPGSTLTDNIPADAQYDAAKAVLGGNWRIPSNDEFGNLFSVCKFLEADGSDMDTSKTDKRVDMPDGNGSTVKGIYIESTVTGNRLFFSCSGRGYGRSWGDRGSNGNYWSSTWSSPRNARNLNFNSGGVNPQNYYNRHYGFPIRPVYPISQ